MSITFPCPKCKGSITPDMQSCIHCGIELVPISIESKPFDSPDTYNSQPSYRPQYHSKQSYKKKPKANLLVVIFFILFFGILSSFGYFMIATDPESGTKKVVGLFLIVVSIIFNLVYFLHLY